ncbi:hypothetical protein O3G_MSEX000556 [Manduca sexta]|nr:hypothetical protein O3G_MSEX000556 [Manduca sexta]
MKYTLMVLLIAVAFMVSTPAASQAVPVPGCNEICGVHGTMEKNTCCKVHGYSKYVACREGLVYCV